MCLIPLIPKLFRLPEDKVVYKFFIRKGRKLLSPYHGFDYLVNKTYSLDKSLEIINNTHVTDGFHSFANLCTLLNFVYRVQTNEARFIGQNIEVRKCIIPKGSNIIYGSDTDIVSDQIIIKEKICV